MAQTASSMLFHFAVASDTHTIDDYYEKGTENGVEDNESILRTTEHLLAARTLINSLQPKIEKVFVDCSSIFGCTWRVQTKSPLESYFS